LALAENGGEKMGQEDALLKWFPKVLAALIAFVLLMIVGTAAGLAGVPAGHQIWVSAGCAIGGLVIAAVMELLGWRNPLTWGIAAFGGVYALFASWVIALQVYYAMYAPLFAIPIDYLFMGSIFATISVVALVVGYLALRLKATASGKWVLINGVWYFMLAGFVFMGEAARRRASDVFLGALVVVLVALLALVKWRFSGTESESLGLPLT
jgi:hypothetical protein